ncbi:MAG: ester cyclase, partial [Anaerolineae bacterium]|nr:ester cyclase [Anaerolineae bacterium]
MSKRTLFLMLALVVLAFSVSAAAAQGYPAPDGKAIITRLMTDILSGGKLELIPEIYAADFVDHSPLGETNGVDGMTAYIGNLRTAFPDMQVETQLLISDADWVAGRFVVSGTFTGELVTPAGAVPGNGGPISIPVHHIWQVN